MDRGAWWAAVYGVTQSWTLLKRLSISSKESFDLEVTEVGDSNGFHQPPHPPAQYGHSGLQECYFTGEDITFLCLGKSFPQAGIPAIKINVQMVQFSVV